MTHLTASEEDLLLEFGFDISTRVMLAQSVHSVSRYRLSSIHSPHLGQISSLRAVNFLPRVFIDVFRVNQADFWQHAVPVPGSQALSCWYFLELRESGSGSFYCVVLRKSFALGRIKIEALFKFSEADKNSPVLV